MVNDKPRPEFEDATTLAARLGLSKKTLYEWARAGRVTSYKFGKSLRFAVSDIEELVAEGRRPAREEAGR